MSNINKASFYAALTGICLNNLGLSVVYPIFTALALEPLYPLLPQTLTLIPRFILLSILIAAFPLTQHITYPVMNKILKYIPHKTFLIITLLGHVIGFTLTGISLYYMNFIALLLSRICSGLFATNIWVCLNYTTHAISLKNSLPCQQLPQHITGMSFVIGIVIGGIFSNHIFDPLFSASTPFWILSILSVFVTIIIICYFQSYSLSPTPLASENLTPSAPLKSMYKGLFFLLLGWTVSIQFLSTFVIEYFSAHRLAVTLIFISTGTAWIIGVTVVNPLIPKRLNPWPILIISLSSSTILLTITSLSHSLIIFTHVILIAAFCISIGWTKYLTLISRYCLIYSQPVVLKTNQSITTLSTACAPIIGGLIGVFDFRMIYLFASCSILISIWFSSVFYKKHL